MFRNNGHRIIESQNPKSWKESLKATQSNSPAMNRDTTAKWSLLSKSFLKNKWCFCFFFLLLLFYVDITILKREGIGQYYIFVQEKGDVRPDLIMSMEDFYSIIEDFGELPMEM